ncbi:MAG TPA: hypothetical protein VMM17_12415 [Gemmatimonadaceae bacterium]|nr:hypothetical protein [Gemmatimonadaceae bacterium]
MTRWRAVIAAAGVCLFLTITLWRDRTGGSAVHVPDLVSSSALALLTVALGWIVGSRLTRDADKRGLIALIGGIWGLAFGTFHILSATYVASAFENTWLAAACWTTLCVLSGYGISRSGKPIPFAARALTVTAVFLLLTQMVQVLESARAGVRRARVGPVAVAKRPADNAPSVYVIVLDKYSSGEWLRHSYGVDNAPFEEALRDLGFVVPRAARANYAHTEISLASFLNWRYVSERPAGAEDANWKMMRELIASAHAWTAFRDQGYRIVAFPTTFPATRKFHSADVQFWPPGLRATVLPMTWWSNSPFPVLSAAGCRMVPCPHRTAAAGVTPYPVESLEVLEWKLDALASLAYSDRPVFAFMHLLAPHEPYLFDANCSAREPWWPLSDQGENFEPVGEAYADQVRCLAPLLLETVRTILDRSRLRPVIVLQSDHGHGRIAVDPLRGFTLSSDELSQEQLGDRLGVFAAYAFPGADTVVREDISPVNVFPLVLRSLFADGPGQQPDRSYWSSYQAAFSFTELPPELTRPPSFAVPAAAQIRAAQPLSPAIR